MGRIENRFSAEQISHDGLSEKIESKLLELFSIFRRDDQYQDWL